MGLSEMWQTPAKLCRVTSQKLQGLIFEIAISYAEDACV